MKKVFIIIMMALMSLGAFAQQLEESSLIGKWEVFDAENEGDFFRGCDNAAEFFEFFDDGTAKATMFGGYTITYTGFWLSNGNWHEMCLNLLLGQNAPVYIDKLVIDKVVPLGEPTTITLKSFKGKSYAVYKKVETASVRSIEMEKNNKSKFNLQGMKVEDPEGVYIQNGKKFVAK